MTSPYKILVADDEGLILDIMTSKIAAQGYKVISARDGEEAWAKIILESPDIILLDITMPKMNGLEVLKRLRSEPPSKKWQPVIIVSAAGDLEKIKESLALEADHYLTKPCRMEDILKAIRMMVSLIPHRNT
jgi:DNA-binding response OmpR family regulator